MLGFLNKNCMYFSNTLGKHKHSSVEGLHDHLANLGEIQTRYSCFPRYSVIVNDVCTKSSKLSSVWFTLPRLLVTKLAT